MASGSDRHLSKPLKNIVVVGLSCAGTDMIRALLDQGLPPDHRILVFDRLPFAYWGVGSLRAAVVPGWEKRIIASFDNVFPRGSPHQVLPSTEVVSISEKDIVVVQCHNQKKLSRIIPFEFCIISSGSSYPFPTRPRYSTAERARDELVRTQKAIADSKAVLCVGGGPIGVEFMGEIATYHPKKKITLVTSSPVLAGSMFVKQLSDVLEDKLTALGVTVILNDTVPLPLNLTTGPVNYQSFTTKGGVSIEADFVVDARGNRANVDFLKGISPSSLSSQGDRRIRVKPTLQVHTEDRSLDLDRIFAIGDASDQRSRAAYVSPSSYEAETVAKNIKNITAERPLIRYEMRPPEIFIGLGPNDGAGQVNGDIVESNVVSEFKSGFLFENMFRSNVNLMTNQPTTAKL